MIKVGSSNKGTFIIQGKGAGAWAPRACINVLIFVIDLIKSIKLYLSMSHKKGLNRFLCV